MKNSTDLIDNLGGIEKYTIEDFDVANVRPSSISYEENSGVLKIKCFYRKEITVRPKNYKHGNMLVFYLNVHFKKRFSVTVSEHENETTVFLNFMDINNKQLLMSGRLNCNILFDYCSIKIDI